MLTSYYANANTYLYVVLTTILKMKVSNNNSGAIAVTSVLLNIGRNFQANLKIFLY